MKSVSITCFLLFLGTVSYSQHGDYWKVFWDGKEEKFGFKDEDGMAVIAPTFGSFSFVKKLEYIFIASEDKDDGFDIYYLTRSGKEFGRDSIYVFDNTPDCESEGFIRFRDRNTERVGMFNKDGKVVIPAFYDDLTQVKNSFVIALKGANKKFLSEHQHSGCNHFTWTGGETLLIDTNNNVIIEKFTNSLNLDFYSHKLHDTPDEQPNREYFYGSDGKTHSFINLEKDFSIWLKQSLLDNFTMANLSLASFSNITFWEEEKGWIREPGEKIIDKNFRIFKERLSAIQSPGQEYFVLVDGLNPFIYESSEYEAYFNNCGQALTEKYPVMRIIVTHEKGHGHYQDHFDFLKTDEGYKLISLTISNGKIQE